MFRWISSIGLRKARLLYQIVVSYRFKHDIEQSFTLNGNKYTQCSIPNAHNPLNISLVFMLLVCY